MNYERVCVYAIVAIKGLYVRGYNCEIEHGLQDLVRVGAASMRRAASKPKKNGGDLRSNSRHGACFLNVEGREQETKRRRGEEGLRDPLAYV